MIHLPAPPHFRAVIRATFSLAVLAVMMSVLALPTMVPAQTNCSPTLTVVGDEASKIVLEGDDFAWKYTVMVTCVDETASPVPIRVFACPTCRVILAPT